MCNRNVQREVYCHAIKSNPDHLACAVVLIDTVALSDPQQPTNAVSMTIHRLVSQKGVQ